MNGQRIIIVRGLRAEASGCADRTAALISARKQPIIASGSDIRSIDILGAQWDLPHLCHSGTWRI